MSDLHALSDATVRAVVVTYFSVPFLDELVASIPTSSTRDVPLTVVDKPSNAGAVEYAAQNRSIRFIH